MTIRKPTGQKGKTYFASMYNTLAKTLERSVYDLRDPAVFSDGKMTLLSLSVSASEVLLREDRGIYSYGDDKDGEREAFHKVLKLMEAEMSKDPEHLTLLLHESIDAGDALYQYVLAKNLYLDAQALRTLGGSKFVGVAAAAVEHPSAEFELIESLQYHPNQRVAQKACYQMQRRNAESDESAVPLPKSASDIRKLCRVENPIVRRAAYAQLERLDKAAEADVIRTDL